MLSDTKIGGAKFVCIPGYFLLISSRQSVGRCGGAESASFLKRRGFGAMRRKFCGSAGNKKIFRLVCGVKVVVECRVANGAFFAPFSFISSRQSARRCGGAESALFLKRLGFGAMRRKFCGSTGNKKIFRLACGVKVVGECRGTNGMFFASSGTKKRESRRFARSKRKGSLNCV